MLTLMRAYRGIGGSLADASVLAVAKERSWAVLSDDNRRGKGMQYVADQEGITYLCTLDLLRRAIRESLISADLARKIVEDMAEHARFRITEAL